MIFDLINTFKEITEGFQAMTQEVEPSPEESRKQKVKKNAVADPLNSSLAAIEKSEDLNHAIASLKAVPIVIMSPEGKSMITNALVTVSAQMESHQAIESDLDEQVQLATAIAEMAMAAAKKLEATAKEKAQAEKKKEEPKPDPLLGLLILAHVSNSFPPNDPRYGLMQSLLTALNGAMNKQTQRPGSPSLPQAGQNSINLQQQMKLNLNMKKNPAQPSPYNMPQAFSTKIPKPTDPKR